MVNGIGRSLDAVWEKRLAEWTVKSVTVVVKL